MILWQQQRLAVALADRSLMALASLWETWRSPPNETIRSFTIVTTHLEHAQCRRDSSMIGYDRIADAGT